MKCALLCCFLPSVRLTPKKPVAVDLERILDDLVLLTFLVGVLEGDLKYVTHVVCQSPRLAGVVIFFAPARVVKEHVHVCLLVHVCKV